MNVINKFKKEIKFLIVGGSSTLLDFLIYMIISKYIDISIAKMISMTISCIYSFLINKQWTFSNKDKINKFLIIKYTICQILNILINTTVNTITYKILNYKIIAFIVATLVAMIFNFLFQNYIVFKKKI